MQFDPHREERSFVLFTGSTRLQPLRRGARVGTYTIKRIERGSVVLATRAQSCSLRLQGNTAPRELRAVSADAIRHGLRARQPLAATSAAAAGGA